MPIMGGGKGDMIVEFEVEFPRRLDQSTREKLAQYLPGPEPRRMPNGTTPVPELLPFDLSWFERQMEERERKKKERQQKKKKKEIYESMSTTEEEEARGGRSPFGGGRGGGPGV